VRVLGVICAANRDPAVAPRPEARKNPSAPFRVQERTLGRMVGEGGREQLLVPARREVPRTAYPRARRSLTIHDPMKPPAPVTQTATAMGARPGSAPKQLGGGRGARTDARTNTRTAARNQRSTRVEEFRRKEGGGEDLLPEQDGYGKLVEMASNASRKPPPVRPSRPWPGHVHVNRESPRP
jgi:hypothetical protein